MADARLFKEKQSSTENLDSYVLAFVKPKNELIESETKKIIEKYTKIKNIVFVVNNSIKSKNEARLNNLKVQSELLQDFINHLAIYLVGVLDGHPAINKCLGHFSEYSAALKINISNIQQESEILEWQHREQNINETISIFETTLAIAISDTKQAAVTELLRQNKSLEVQAPAPKKKKECNII